MVELRFLYKVVRAELNFGAVLYDESGQYRMHLAELFPFASTDGKGN